MSQPQLECIVAPISLYAESPVQRMMALLLTDEEGMGDYAQPGVLEAYPLRADMTLTMYASLRETAVQLLALP